MNLKRRLSKIPTTIFAFLAIPSNGAPVWSKSAKETKGSIPRTSFLSTWPMASLCRMQHCSPSSKPCRSIFLMSFFSDCAETPRSSTCLRSPLRLVWSLTFWVKEIFFPKSAPLCSLAIREISAPILSIFWARFWTSGFSFSCGRSLNVGGKTRPYYQLLHRQWGLPEGVYLGWTMVRKAVKRFRKARRQVQTSSPALERVKWKAPPDPPWICMEGLRPVNHLMGGRIIWFKGIPLCPWCPGKIKPKRVYP